MTASFTIHIKITDLAPVVHVALVAEDHLLHVGRCVLLDVSDPVLDVVEALLVRDVVHQHDAHGAPVVGGGDGPEPLLSRRVPYLQLDFLPVQLDCPDLEVDACKRLTGCIGFRSGKGSKREPRERVTA